MDQQSLLPSVWDVPEEFRNRLGRSAGRQRAMFSNGHLLLILHAPPSPEDTERTGRFFWREPDGTWNYSGAGSGAQALRNHLDEFEAIVESLEKEDETAVSSTDYFSTIYRLTPAYRAMRNMHQALQQAREFIPDDRDLINIRDRAYQIERTADLLLQDAQHSLEFEIARRAEDQASNSYRMAISAHRLNVLAAFFFPIVTLSAIFGVNMQHGLEDLPGPLPLLGVLAVGLLMGFILMGFINPKSPESNPNKK